MVDAEALADCFDHDELRGYKPIRNFTREERRVIATALRELRANRRAFYGAECPSYPNCSGGCGLGCTKKIVRDEAFSVSPVSRPHRGGGKAE